MVISYRYKTITKGLKMVEPLQFPTNIDLEEMSHFSFDLHHHLLLIAWKEISKVSKYQLRFSPMSLSRFIYPTHEVLFLCSLCKNIVLIGRICQLADDEIPFQRGRKLPPRKTWRVIYLSFLAPFNLRIVE